MHLEAHDWVARWRTDEPVDVLDIGGRNINGSCRDLFPNGTYTCIDKYDGPGVDIVADAALWVCDKSYDLVISTEVFEHCEEWPELCALAHRATRDKFVCTMAGPGRREHSGIDGNERRPEEWYENVNPDRLYVVLKELGFFSVVVDVQGLDVRAVAVK